MIKISTPRMAASSKRICVFLSPNSRVTEARLFKISINGLKSNNQIAHFLVDIHTIILQHNKISLSFKSKRYCMYFFFGIYYF